MKLDPSMQAVLAVYQNGGEISNDHLYQAVKEPLGFDDDDYNVRHAIGKAGKKHCVAQRKVRWFQQSLRRLELVERVPGRRGVWRLRPREDQQLTPPVPGMTLVGFSTNLGVALWSSCDVFQRINEPVALLITSPPYPLAKPRLYGGPTEPQMVDFVCKSLEPVVKNLLPGGSVALNVSNTPV